MASRNEGMVDIANLQSWEPGAFGITCQLPGRSDSAVWVPEEQHEEFWPSTCSQPRAGVCARREARVWRGQN